MSLRACCYKDCENYSINNATCDDFTLFQFPKDVNRRKIWMELGQVDSRIAPHELYMCSDHFDRRKYMSVNKRRTILLGNAEPFPYIAKPIEENLLVAVESTKEEEDIQCVEQDTAYMFFEDDEVEVGTNIQVQKNESEKQFQVESTIGDDDEENLFTYSEMKTGSSAVDVEEIDDYSCTGAVSKVYKLCQNPVVTLNKKRRVMEIVTPSTQKSIKHTAENSLVNFQVKQKSQSETTISIPDGNNAMETDIDESTLIDPEFVSTFIYKSEEYVQMPKEYFLKDKLNLLWKAKKYENALKSIKHRLNVLDLS